MTDTSDRLLVKVAVYFLLIKENKILLLRRYNTGWRDGSYTPPAGHLEKGETIVECMSREAFEEVGINVKPDDLKVVHIVHQCMDSDYIDFYLTAKEWQGEPYLKEPEKADDVQWFSLDHLPENLLPNVRAALKQYQNGEFFSEFL